MFVSIYVCVFVCDSICTINGTALQGPLNCNSEAIEMAELRFDNDTNATLGVSHTHPRCSSHLFVGWLLVLLPVERGFARCL